jgi:hypothetical protein
VEYQGVLNEEAVMETIRVLVDHSGDQQPAVGCQNPQKRRTRDNVVQGAPEGWTRPECNNRIKERGIKQQPRLGKQNTLNERTLCEALRWTSKPETVKIAIMLSGRLKKMRE